MTATSKPRIAITVGDPAGIGPEIAARAAADPRVTAVCEPLLYGPPPGASFPPRRTQRRSRPIGDTSRSSRAVDDVRSGAADAMATAPINKEAWRLAGLPWSGHTDLLAHLTGTADVAMMFYSDALRVVLATIHIPLADVPRALTQASLETTIALTAAALPRFGFPAPRIAVAGLNPHAGEHGLFGQEEIVTLSPAIAASRSRGIEVSGPYPADTLFVRAHRGEFDAVVACYHDQGLIPVKLLAFGHAVNVTLGLPIVRTSVDHGTAFDIAGRGVADPESMIAAVLLAARLSEAVRLNPADPVEAGPHDESPRTISHTCWVVVSSFSRASEQTVRVRVPRPSCVDRAVVSGFSRTVTMKEQTEREKAQANIAENRKAFHDFHLLETFEAGIMLLGTEAKAIREGRVNLRDSFARVEDGEVYLYNVNISPYSHRGYADHEPLRRRKLLLHRDEIRKLIGKTVEKGMTLVPVRMYFKNGRVKVAVSLAKGKKDYDKRETIKRREIDRETRVCRQRAAEPLECRDEGRGRRCAGAARGGHRPRVCRRARGACRWRTRTST